MRSHEEIETRLKWLVAFLAYADPAEESVVRAHARALDMIWVLFPSLSLDDSLALLKTMVTEKEAPSILDQAQHNPAIICTECGQPSPAGLFYVGDWQLCGPCAEKYM